MNLQTGYPDHIEDYLVTVRTGGWFDWTDPNNKIYENLNVIDGGTKPTEQECTDGLAAMQAAWTLENNSYRSKRREEYPYLAEQLDYIYNHGIDKWKTDVIDPIKAKYPKPE